MGKERNRTKDKLEYTSFILLKPKNIYIKSVKVKSRVHLMMGVKKHHCNEILTLFFDLASAEESISLC